MNLAYLACAIMWTIATIAWLVSAAVFKSGNKGLTIMGVAIAVVNAVPAIMYYILYMKQ